MNHEAFVNSDVVDVWSAEVSESPDVVEFLSSLLDRRESGRAAAYRFDRDRNRYVVARGILRLLLMRYTGVPARAVTFCCGANGKPSMAPHDGARSIHFNVSHSASLVAYAFTTAGPVGIDVERLRPIEDAQAVARRFFSPVEYAELMSVDPSQFARAFLTIWTRKEACVKETGEGLSRDPRRVEVSLRPAVSRARIETSNGEETASWHVHDLGLNPSYVGAVAIRAPGAGLRLRDSVTAGAFIEYLARS